MQHLDVDEMRRVEVTVGGESLSQRGHGRAAGERGEPRRHSDDLGQQVVRERHAGRDGPRPQCPVDLVGDVTDLDGAFHLVMLHPTCMQRIGPPGPRRTRLRSP
jgi:hypothetical protein